MKGWPKIFNYSAGEGDARRKMSDAKAPGQLLADIKNADSEKLRVSIAITVQCKCYCKGTVRR